MGADAASDIEVQTDTGRLPAYIGVIVLALVFPLFMTWLSFIVVAQTTAEHHANPALQVLYFAGKTFQFSLPILAVLLFERRWPRPALPDWRGLGPGLAFGLLVGAGALGLYFGLLRGTRYFRETPAMLHAKLLEFGAADPESFLLFSFFICVIHSLFEEYYWRWFVFRGLERLLPLVPAMAVSAIGFMGHHMIVLAVYFPGRFFAMALPMSLLVAGGGFVWAWLYHRSGSIYAPWLSHVLIDVAIMAVGYDLVFFQHPV